MYKVCIFDLDGTLTNTLESLTYSVNETLSEMGLSQITAAECRQFVGNGARVLMEKALRAVGDEKLLRIDEAMEVYGRIFDANCTYHVVPYPGILEMLDAMAEAGLKLAVLSNKPHQQTVHVVEEIFGTGRFQKIQGQKEGIPRKPDPTAAILIASELGADVSETVYVGDSEVDIATGTAAHMKTIGVSWGFRERKILEGAGAGCIADSPDKIMKLIEE